MFENIKKRVMALGQALRSSLSRPERWLIDFFGGGTESHSGEQINKDAAVSVTAVFACIRILSETLATLPLHVYKRVKAGKERAYDLPLYEILHSQVNPLLTSARFRQLMMINILLTGDGYAEIVRDGSGSVKELWPLPSDHVSKKVNIDTKEYFYEVYTYESDPRFPNGTKRYLYPENMLHIQGPALMDFCSFEPLRLAREAIGLSMATERFGANFFKNGANASGIAEYPNKMSDEAYERFKKSFNDRFTGLSNNQRVMFLEQGLKFTKLTIDPNQAQSLETRKFQVVEIARFFGVPLHLVMDLDKATFSNIEHQDIEFVKYHLRPWLVFWEQEMRKSLFLVSQRKTYFAEFDVDGLLRGDALSRAQANEIKRRNGVLNADEWRAMDNLNEIEDGSGKIYYVPLNWIQMGNEPYYGAPVEDSPEPESDPDPQSRTMDLGDEKRASKGAITRQNITRSYQKVIGDYVLQVVKRERADIMRQTEKMLKNRGLEDFKVWMETFYRDNYDFAYKKFYPSMSSLAEAIYASAADQVNMDTKSTEDMITFVDDYVGKATGRYISRSKGQLMALVNQSTSDDELITSLEERFDDWEEKRPLRVAREESVGINGSVSRFAFKAAGFTKLVWRNTGSKTCPFCEQLDGKVVGIEDPFIGVGEDITASDGSGMKVYGAKLNPPIHDGCQCSVDPG